MLEINSHSSLATISRQMPAGIQEADRIVRDRQSGPLAPSDSSAASLPATIQDKNTLNTSPVQRIADTSGSNLQTRMNASKDEQAAQQEQMKIDQVVSQLKARDREVKAHEQAHLAVAGQYATGLSYSYQTGPDGKRYAIGGEVGIDTSPISGDPQATIQKAMVVQSAAMAPAEPSSQDYRVASSARQMMAEARAELSAQETESSADNGTEGNATNAAQNAQSNDNNRQALNQGKQDQQGQNNIAPQDELSAMISDRAAFETRLQMPTGHEMVADLVNPS